jgi:DNA primase
MESKKLHILKDILGSPYKSRNEYLFHCPYCDHQKKKLSINLEKNVYKCWVCDTRGANVQRLVRRFGSYKQKQTWASFEAQIDYSLLETLFDVPKEVKQTVELPPEFISLANRDTPASGFMARKYLKERGVNKRDIIWWKMGYCSSGEYENRIIIPSFNDEGNADYFIARSYVGDFPKYKNPPVGRDIIFNDLFVDWTDDVVLVEGAFDAITVGHNAVPLLGSTLREESKLFHKIVQNDTPVYLALDPDAEKKSLNIINKLLTYDVELYKINIYPHVDVGEMTREQFIERKSQARLMTFDECMISRTKNIR